MSGIHLAMDYLTASTRSLLDNALETAPIHARGKDVVVVGGGDTGTDCVATAMRQGCRSIVQLEILPRPPEERAIDNPWPEWPRVDKLDYGQQEAAARFGSDPRCFSTTAKEFIADADGCLTAILTETVRWLPNASGHTQPVAVAGTERILPAQLALLALGFHGPEQPLFRNLSIATDSRGNALADYGSYMTSAKGVFAAGDCRRGQSLVVWAINEGRGAARECDRYLSGRSVLP